MKGTFVNANSEGIKIVIAGNTLTLKWDDISQIVFTDVVSDELLTKNNNSQEDSKEKQAIENALRALRKLSSATEVGVNFREYGSRLIDAKGEVNESLSNISNEYIKNEIKLSMDAYGDASIVWNGFIQGTSRYLNRYPYSDSWKYMVEKYSIKIDESNITNEKSVALSTIWAAGRRHIENASNGKTDQETK